jgi:DNA polymerase-1
LRGTSGSPAASESESSDEIQPTQVAQIDLPESKSLAIDALLAWIKNQNEVGLHVGFNGKVVTSLGASNLTERYSASISDSDLESVADYLKSSSPKTIFGAKDVERKLLEAGLPLSGVTADPYLYAYLLNPIRRGYGLDDLSSEYLGISVQRSDANQLVPETVVDSSLDAWLAIALASRLWPIVEEQGQDRVYEEVEAPSSATLAKMEATGITVDEAALNALLEKLTGEVAQSEKSCFEIIGKEINLASPKQLQTVLFEDLGMTGNKKVKPASRQTPKL